MICDDKLIDDLRIIIRQRDAEIEIYKKESVLKNGLINQYKDEIEKYQKLRGSAWILAGLIRTEESSYQVSSMAKKALKMVEDDLAELGKKE